MERRVLMRKNRGFALLLALLVCIATAISACADFAKGKVVNGVYDNGDGISFPMPSGFSLARQENKKAGFFRISLSGLRDKNGFGPAILVDVIPGTLDVSEYSTADMIAELYETYGANYKDEYLIASETFTEYGVDARRAFLVYRDGGSQNRTSYLNVYLFSTDRNIVRIVYDCYGAQRTMVDDLYSVQDLFNSIMVP